jgi:hypothetical protein
MADGAAAALPALQCQVAKVQDLHGGIRTSAAFTATTRHQGIATYRRSRAGLSYNNIDT